jgi:hypothetical protein
MPFYSLSSLLSLDRLSHRNEFKKYFGCTRKMVASDLDLLPEKIREAAHLRWHIENNLFKRLSHHNATKRFYFKDPNAFFAMLRLFCAATALLDIVIQILKRDEPAFKGLLNGMSVHLKRKFNRSS